MKKGPILKEQELPQIEDAILARYDVKQSGRVTLQPTVDDAKSEIKLRRTRTICLRDCAIPE
jgi:hypothetical protein